MSRPVTVTFDSPEQARIARLAVREMARTAVSVKAFNVLAEINDRFDEAIAAETQRRVDQWMRTHNILSA